MGETRYAAGTTVSADRSRAEIERTLTRYGARGFMYGWDQERAVLGFITHGRLLAHLVLPSGEAVAQAIGPGIEEAYRTGTTPQLLPPTAARLEIER